MTTLTLKCEPLFPWATMEEGLDSHKHVMMFDRKESTVLQVARDLGATWENHRANPENNHLTRYKDSECTYVGRGEENELVIFVDVGCWCEHDCCGHMCDLQYYITISPQYIIVMRHTSYNY